MYSLEAYRKLSDEDKNNLTYYNIYNDIENNCNERSMKIDDATMVELKDIIYDYYIEDCYCNFPIGRITDFISSNYLDGNASLEELKEANYSLMYDAIENDCIDLIKKQSEELER